MKRIAVLLIVLAGAAGALVAAGAGAERDRAGRFTVELDNAFGLVEGGDMKVAGVRAGTITGLRVAAKGKRALVDFQITKRGFGSLRTDTFCESRPQSLIGEYFLDCLPGKAKRELPAGSTIPVERTASTVPLDLLNNVLRRPYRERLRIILDELGGGVGARAEDLNESIRRLSPALRETDKTLALLASQNDTIVALTEDADTVIGDLADNREDVGRWVEEAQQTATASAERRVELAAGFRKLPGFLRELRPTMASLGTVADRQLPSLRDLNASAGQLERFLENLGPFAEASRVNIRSLADTAKVGRRAVRTAGATVAELSRASVKAPELASNLAIVLEHLDDRDNAAEKDPRSPEGKGYTGLEAFLQYAFDQVMAINVYDQNGYILKVNAFEDKCASFQNAESVQEEERKSPGFIEDCGAFLGPNQPGVLQPDPTRGQAVETASRRARTSARRGGAGRPGTPAAERERRSAPAPTPAPGRAQGPAATPAPATAPAPPPSESPDAILDYLFGR